MTIPHSWEDMAFSKSLDALCETRQLRILTAEMQGSQRFFCGSLCVLSASALKDLILTCQATLRRPSLGGLFVSEFLWALMICQILPISRLQTSSILLLRTNLSVHGLTLRSCMLASNQHPFPGRLCLFPDVPEPYPAPNPHVQSGK
jgi:hypothetical protein